MLFERWQGALEDRGAGIASSFAHLDQLKARDLIDANYPHVPFHTNMWTRPTADDPKGRSLWKSPGTTGGMNRGVLFANHHNIRTSPAGCMSTTSTMRKGNR